MADEKTEVSNETPVEAPTEKLSAGIEKDLFAPFIKLEILVQGTEADREKMTPMMKSLQKQINKHPKHARVLHYIDKGELTVEEKRKKLIELANCKYYVFASDAYIVPNVFVTKCLDRINTFERGLKELKKQGVKPMKKVKRVVAPESEVVETNTVEPAEPTLTVEK